jgi:hypothetical protein
MVAMAACLSLLAAGCWSISGSSVASPSPGQTFRQSVDEFMLSLKECTEAKGYGWRFDRQGDGFSISGQSGLAVSEEQRQREQEDLRACIAAIDPARLEPPPRLTPVQYEQMYRYVLAQTECLRAAGYPVSDPPPLDVYVDSDRAFDPYVDLRDRGVSVSDDDVVRCQSDTNLPDFMQ